MIPVGVSDVDLDFLSRLSKGGAYGRDFMHAPDFSQMNLVFDDTAELACSIGAQTTPARGPGNPDLACLASNIF